MKTTYTFSYSDGPYDGEMIDVSMSIDGPQTWREVTDFYLQYLRGCGFVLSKEALLTYLADRGIEYADAVEENGDNLS